MTTVIAFHEVDDTDHWLASPKRGEVFGAKGVAHRTFVNPARPGEVGLIVDLPDGMSLDDLAAFLQTPEAIEAEKYDGVRMDTLKILVERSA